MPTREWISVLLFFIVLHLGISVYILRRYVHNQTAVIYCSVSISINIILFVVGIVAYRQAVHDESNVTN